MPQVASGSRQDERQGRGRVASGGPTQRVVDRRPIAVPAFEGFDVVVRQIPSGTGTDPEERPWTPARSQIKPKDFTELRHDHDCAGSHGVEGKPQTRSLEFALAI